MLLLIIWVLLMHHDIPQVNVHRIMINNQTIFIRSLQNAAILELYPTYDRTNETVLIVHRNSR